MLNEMTKRSGEKRYKAESALALAAVLAMIAVVLFALFGSIPTANAAPTNTNNALALALTVPGTCVPVITNTLITFPNTQAGKFADTANAENVMDQGNTASNIIVFGGASAGDTTGNWISTDLGTSSFLVTNTLWDLKSHAANNGNQLANIITSPSGQDTQMPVQANGGANAMFFGLNVPTGQTADSYNELITVSLTC